MADIAQMIADAANAYGVTPALALEVATAESRLNQSAVSPRGAIGIFQLMPATAAQLGVNPHDLQQNIQGGVRYLAQMLGQFSDVSAALAAYDWGPGSVSRAVAQWGANWLTHAPAETQNYVAEILDNLGTQYQVQATQQSSDQSSEVPPPVDPNAVPADSSSIWTNPLLLGAIGLLAILLFEELG